MTIKRFIFVLLLISLPGLTAATAQETATKTRFAENLEIKLAVIGAADAVYSWWGHIAFIIKNTETGAARYYDYGNFSFDQESFLKNFIMGRMYYLKMASNPDRQLHLNAYLNRDVTVYTLDISLENRIKLFEFLENDILPENRVYLYNLLSDNCSTRIRDMMDLITDNEFSRKYMVQSEKTLRMQIRRFLYSNKLIDWLFNFTLSGMVDKPSTDYDAMFLPKELARGVETMMISDAMGNIRPLVKDKEIYNRSEGRPEVPDYPPSNWQYGLIVGILLAAAALLLKHRGATIFSMIFSFVFAVPGSLLFFMACFTDHDYTHWNMNLLFINPLLLVTFILSIRALVKKSSPPRSIRIFWTITAIGGLLSIILKLFPFFRQDNWETLLIFLPAAIILGLVPLYKDIITKRKDRTTADSL